MSRDKSGRFIISDATIQTTAAAERMKACLERDVRRIEHADGKVYERGHYHALPGVKLQVVESDIPHTGRMAAPDLFERVAA